MGRTYKYGGIVYDTHDGDGTCMTAVCAEEGNINRTIGPCSTTVPTQSTTTGFVFSTSGKNKRLQKLIGVEDFQNPLFPFKEMI